MFNWLKRLFASPTEPALVASLMRSELFHRRNQQFQREFGLPSCEVKGAYLLDESASIVAWTVSQCMRRAGIENEQMQGWELVGTNVFMFAIADALGQIGDLPFERLTVAVSARLWASAVRPHNLGALISVTAREFNRIGSDASISQHLAEIGDMMWSLHERPSDDLVEQLAITFALFIGCCDPEEPDCLLSPHYSQFLNRDSPAS